MIKITILPSLRRNREPIFHDCSLATNTIVKTGKQGIVKGLLFEA
jgi:hypothetical protein